MSNKIKFEDLIEIDTQSEINTAAEIDEVSWFEEPQAADAGIILIEEKVSVGWSGVDSCHHSDRVQAEVRYDLQKWIQKKLFEHRNWRYIRAGAKASRVSCHQWKDPWSGKRSCGCRGAIPFYIEFRKP